MKWWSAITLGLAALFLSFNIAYRAGGDSVEVRGQSLDFRRGHDFQLYSIDDRSAVLVTASHREAEELAIVQLGHAPFPFSVLCGRYQPDGFTTDFEKVRVARSLAGYQVSRSPHPTPGERDRVMVRMKPIEAQAKLRPLSTCNESCVTFNAAFLLLFAAALIALPILLIMGRRGRTP